MDKEKILRGTIASVKRYGYAIITDEELELIGQALEERGFRVLDAGEDWNEVCEEVE